MILDRNTLSEADQKILREILSQGGPDHLSSEQFGYLNARRDYLTEAEKQAFGITDKPKKSSKEDSEAEEGSEEEVGDKPAKSKGKK